MTQPASQPRGRAGWRQHLPMILFLGAAVWLLFRSHVYSGPKTVDIAGLGLRDLNGIAVPASAYADKVVVLNFWAPWCGPCRVEMPWLEALQRDHPEVSVIGIEDDPGALDTARAMALNHGISYTVAEPSGAIRRSFGSVSALPTTFYISRTGRVVHTVTGVVPAPVMRYYLRDALRSR
jgi:thiol-disulfide isomerase/thioredoxin